MRIELCCFGFVCRVGYMDQKEYILKKAYEVHWLAGRIMNADGEICIKPFKNFERSDPVLCTLALRKALYVCRDSRKQKYNLYEEEGYFYYVYSWKEKMIIWGPFVWEAHSEHEKKYI